MQKAGRHHVSKFGYIIYLNEEKFKVLYESKKSLKLRFCVVSTKGTNNKEAEEGRENLDIWVPVSLIKIKTVKKTPAFFDAYDVEKWFWEKEIYPKIEDFKGRI